MPSDPTLDRQYSPRNYAEFIRHVPVPQETIDFFAQFPCARPFLGPSSPYKPIPFLSQYKHEDTSNTFFNETINTSRTVIRFLTVSHEKLLDESQNDNQEIESILPNPTDPGAVLFAQVGSGLNGFRDTVHGGVIAGLMDEALGVCLEGYRQKLSGKREPLFTANLNISYVAPVSSPGVIFIKAWVRKREGRKWFVEAQLCGEDGQVKTVAKSLWVGQKPSSQL